MGEIMKNQLSLAAVTAIATLLSANVFASESQYDMSIYTLPDQAIVKVTENGQPVSQVPVEVDGGSQHQTLMTSEHGTVIVENNENHSRSFKISVNEPNGEKIVTHRFISVQH
ncbi:hypothetical protein BSQ33_20005 [Vibrio gazogenes]|uniref:Uncharacterized protein n=2 Tax=Vibrio gazogenes TaxID=687 RepID=A0A1Z2SLB3_VIBGA|nr:hypothetical protein BSQ33_20005 [Vibrio gazogenes]